MHPAESLAWHRQAAEWSGDSPIAHAELALEFTRPEDCEHAVDSWSKVDAAGMLEGYFPAVFAYCQLKLGHDREAFALMERAEYGHPGQFEGLLEEIWGERPALARHGDLLAAFRAGKPDEAEALLAAAHELSEYSGQRQQALLEIAKAADAAGSTSADLRDLSCLRPVYEGGLANARERERADDDYSAYDPDKLDAQAAEAALRWRKGLDACGLVLSGHRLPASESLARGLLEAAVDLKLATPQELLAAHGPALKARAESASGDFAALDVLAALQMLAQDKAGVAASDQLGWERYGNARFAASRVLGQLIADGKVTEATKAMLVRAAAQFPDDAQVGALVIKYGGLEGEARKQALRRQVLAEFHGPTEQMLMHSGKSAKLVVMAMNEYRRMVEAVAPAPAQAD
jgi:hypothetical protein